MPRILILLVLLLYPASLLAQTALPPDRYALNLKGVLNDNAGNPRANGSYTVQFRLYEVASGPNAPVFTETQTVAVFTTPALVAGQADRKGKYSVSLGYQNSNPLRTGLFVNKTLWLEIWVNGAAPPPGTLRKPILQIPADSVIAKSMSQVLWVTNALYHIDLTNARETAALAFYIRTIYENIPSADPNYVLRSLVNAQSVFNQRYRSPQTGAYRVSMLPIDAVVNLYGILVQQPGNPVTLPIIGESLTFAAGDINLTGGSSIGYQQFSYELGRMASNATFNEYQNQQLEALYLLARQNPRVALVVDTFFGFGYNANVTDSLFSILNKNPGLRDSPNFAPLRSQIEADGTMLTTLDTTLANVAEFYDRMTVTTRTMANAMGQMTRLQRNDYAGTPGTAGTGAAVQTAFRNAFNQAAPALQAMDASSYANGVVLKSDAGYSAYLATAATYRFASATAKVVAKTASMVAACTPDIIAPSGVEIPDPAGIVAAGGEVVAASIDMAAAGLDFVAAAGGYGISPTGVLKDGIVQVGNQIANLQTQIDQRTALIDQHIVDLYNQMNTNFDRLNQALTQGLAAISNALDNLRNDIITVQYTLDRLTQSFSTFATQSQRATLLVPPLTVINSWGETPPPPPPGADYFNQQFNACATYATSTVLTNAENGNLGQDGFSSLYGDTDILSQLDGNNEKNLNYLMAFIYNRFYLRPSPEDVANYIQPAFNFLFSPRLANPTAWEMSSLGMMRAATLFPDLGLPYVQAGNSSFEAAYNLGKNLQDAANSLTLQQRVINGVAVVEKSPVFANMLRHHNLMANKLIAEIINAETNGYPPNFPRPNPDLPSRVAFVLNQLNLDGSPLNRAAKALDGSQRLLQMMCELGLSRSIKANDLLSSLLYSNGVSTFRDPRGSLSADPNAQRLPDGTLVKALYNNWVASLPPAPAAPTATAIAGASSLLPGTYYVTVTYFPAGSSQESLPSSESAVTIGTGQQLRVASPNAAGAARYRVYVGTASGGAYYLQNGAGTATGAALTIAAPIKSYNSTPPAEQFNRYVTADPKTVFQTAQATRWNRFSQQLNGAYVPTTDGSGPRYINGILDNLVADARRNGLVVGEQVATVDAIMSRLSFFLIPTVNGTIQGQPLTNLPANMQPRSLANTAVTLQFNGLNSLFSAPVLLDNTGRYTVYVPRDEYTVLARAEGFQQNKIQVPGNVPGYVNTRTGTTLRADARLIVGDLTGDNQINNNDLIALRNAFNSALSSPEWSFYADLNGDGVVDTTDRALIQSRLGATPSSPNWNPRFDLNADGVINNVDLNIIDSLLTTPPLRTPSPGWNAAADLNLDGRVDIADESLLQMALGSTAQSRNWFARADINHDGTVNLADLALLQSALGTQSGTPTYDTRYDLNYDGVVDYRDQILLQGALYATTADPRWNAKADLNGDGRVDGTDQTILFNALNSIASSPNWNPAADLNNDGIVDYHDQEIVQGKIGTRPQDINWDSRFDFNGDGKIDQTDINLLQTRLGARAASLNWNPLADLNGDNVVDNLDLQMLRSNFGRQGQR